jgi:photosystem II stability/assembly factor-like uncharacterized protein
MRILAPHRPRSFLLLSLACLLLGAVPGLADEPKGGPPELKRLKLRSIGPSAGGRVCRACGVPGDPLTYYAATAAGGVWKSADGGISWHPVFDDQPIATIGSIAVAPSDPNVLYAGSGEGNIRGNVQPGNGIYRSTDAGKTWQHVWKQEGQIGTMTVHPANPDVAYAAVLGHAFGPNEERGVYRTTDGGKSWKRVLFKDRDTGASDVCLDPHNPRILFAGLWQVRRRPWELVSGGPGSGLWTSRDGGDTWVQLVPTPGRESPDFGKDAPEGKKYCDGLPEGNWGKVCVAVAPSDPRRIYAMIEAEKGGLYRSDDGGETWKLANGHHGLRQRAWYFSTLTVHPRNADVVYFPQVPLLRTTDGGRTLERVKGPHHGDHHDVWIDPKNPDRMIDSNDGGVDISVDGGRTWYGPPLPICQFYHVACDNRTPYYVSGCIQDIGTACGPSNSLVSGGIKMGDWYPVGGGETGFTAHDADDPNIVYAGEYGGYLSRYDHRTRQVTSIGIYPYNPSGHGGADLRLRFQWTAPLLLSPHDPKVIYHAAQILFRSEDAGRTWTAISPDLTRNDKEKQKESGGPLTGDNTGVEIYDTIYAVAESPKQKGLLWVGSDDGLVHVTHDGGKNWTNVTPKELPEWGTVVCIEPSPFDAETALVVVDAHRLDDMRPYLFRTADGGKTWKRLGADLPQDVYLRVVRFDPQKKGLLYLGSDRGLAFSRDDGATWTPLKLNFPTVAVCDLVVKGDDLVVGTSGRSIWILDDLTPLREMGPGVLEKPAFLFPAPPVYRYLWGGALEEEQRRGVGANPPVGAAINYHLKAKPKGDIQLEVLDARGQVVVRFSSKEEEKEPEDVGDYSEEKDKKLILPLEPGLHRIHWNLRYEGAQPIKKAKVDSGKPREGPLVLPGTYTLRLTVDGQVLTTPLEVRFDPRERLGQPFQMPPAVLEGLAPPVRQALLRADPQAPVSQQDLEEQLQFVLKVRDDINRLARTVEQLRAVRQQIQVRDKLLADDARAAPLVKMGKEAAARLDALEERLHNPKAKVVYDILAQKGGAQLYSQLIWLYEMARAGERAPNQGLKEVYAEQSALLQKYEAEWQALLSGELAKLNEQARQLQIPDLILPAPPKAPK